MSGPALLPYWPGASRLHRAPVGLKLLALLASGTIVLLWKPPAVSGGVLVAAVAGILAAGVPPRVLARHARPIVFLVAILCAFQWLIGRPAEGLLAGGRILAVAAVALAVTLTTHHTAMVTWLEATLRRLRVRPDRVFRLALTVGVALRSLDHLGLVAARVLDARRARGLSRSLRAFAVPTVVAAARYAHGVGEALDARGIADPDPPSEGGG